MVEDAVRYNTIFHALADETRRDILLQVNAGEKTITEIAKKYSMSFAAIAKHLTVLESAALILKRKQGRAQVVSANPQTITDLAEYLKRYEAMWNQKFDKLEQLVKEI
ncbi:MAG: metalloregulator ArsR/SmtB family transcription factor [Candidatus Saccharimonadales bacterium]